MNRGFIFDDRIEIINPGHLPNNLTVDKIRAGNSNIRNPILIYYIAKGLLPYGGIGSGIRRALDDWSNIDFVDDREGCLFTVKIHRTFEKGSGKTEIIPDTHIVQQEGSEKSSGKILELLAENPEMTIPQLANELGISTRAIEKHIANLQKNKVLRRIGPAKGGHWQVVK
jgi:ATP-dependent DNA helicase RecG